VTHADVRELIASYAVGALEPEDTSLVQEHLVDCGFCANLAREASEVAHYLPYAAPSREAPVGSLERLLVAVAGEGAPSWAAVRATGSHASSSQGAWAPDWPAAAAPSRLAVQATGTGKAAAAGRSEALEPRPGRLQLPLSRWLARLKTPIFAPAAAAVVVLLGMAGWNMLLMGDLKDERHQMSTLQSRLAQQTHLMVMVTSDSSVTRPLQGTPLAPSAEIRLIMDGETNSAMLMATRLPPLPVDRVYQVWLGRQGARMPAGRLVVDDHGDGECNLQLDGSVHSYDSAWITLEPAEGGPMPNSPGVAKGLL